MRKGSDPAATPRAPASLRFPLWTKALCPFSAFEELDWPLALGVHLHEVLGEPVKQRERSDPALGMEGENWDFCPRGQASTAPWHTVGVHNANFALHSISQDSVVGASLIWDLSPDK